MFLGVYQFDGELADLLAAYERSEFHSAVAEAGLPMPRIEAIGEVRAAHLREAAGTRA